MGKPKSVDHQSQGALTKLLTIEEIRRKKKPNKKEVSIILDSDLGSAIRKKQEELEHATRMNVKGRSLADVSPQKIQIELDDMISEAMDTTVTFIFQDIGRKRFNELVENNPPTPEQKQLWKDEENPGHLGYNLETFPIALITATCIEPKMKYEDVESLFEEWGEGDIEALFAGALGVCKERTSIPLSKRVSEPIADSALSSTSASSTSISPTVDSANGVKETALKP